MDTTPANFLRLPARHSAYEHARYAVLPVPYDATTSFRPGARFGPAAMLAASEHFELYDEETHTEPYQAGIATLDAVEPVFTSPEAMHDALRRHAARVVKGGKFLLTFGGEHSITAALVAAVHAKHRQLSVLQIDAHADLRDAWHGTPYSHACVMRRIHEQGVPFVSLGIRSYSREEQRFIRHNGIEMVTARAVHTEADWADRVLAGLTDTVYISVDIDGFDPAYAPGTGTPEPGGLDWYQVTGLLRRVAREKTIVAGDIVEVSPIPGQSATELLAARLAYKLIAYVEAAR